MTLASLLSLNSVAHAKVKSSEGTGSTSQDQDTYFYLYTSLLRSHRYHGTHWQEVRQDKACCAQEANHTRPENPQKGKQ